MKDFAVITDTCADLDADLLKKYGIEHMEMSVSNRGEDIVVDLNWKPFSPKEFYDMMKNGEIFKTAAVSYKTFLNTYESYLKKDIDILYLSVSSALSGSYNLSLQVAEELLKKYPASKIISVDTLISSLGQGLLCIEAAKLKKAGKTIDETAKWIEDNKLNAHQAGTVENLTYLKQAGRITGMAALMGGLFKLKPLIISDIKGRNVSISKTRGRKASLNELIEYMKENIINAEEQTIYISHANCNEKELEEFKKNIKEAFNVKEFYVNFIGPIVGSSVGPGTCGVYFMGKKKGYDADKK